MDGEILPPTYPSLHTYFPFSKIKKVASVSNQFPSIPILTTLHIYPGFVDKSINLLFQETWNVQKVMVLMNLCFQKQKSTNFVHEQGRQFSLGNFHEEN